MKILPFLATGVLSAATYLLTGCCMTHSESCGPGVVTGGAKTVLTETDAGKPVSFEAGANFRLELASNATTGYSWKIAESPAGIVKATGSRYVQDPQGAVGGGGKQIFAFQAASKGTTTIRLTYRQPWKGGTVGRHVDFKITVC